MIETFLNNKVTLHPGDCLDVLARLEESSVDSVVCDPPYHLTSIVKRFGGVNIDREKFAQRNGSENANQRLSRGFMGKIWDGGDISFRPETWAEVFRVLKPGSHLVAIAGTRTYHRMACAIEDAGFEIRDQIQWLYGSGFPKSHNAGNGFGTALKPANEPICLARKPLIGTVAENVQQWGTGALNIDGCRVATDDALAGGRYADLPDLPDGVTYGTGINKRSKNEFQQPLGRWPANIVHDGSDEVVVAFPESTSTGGQASLGAFRNGDVYGKGRDEREKRDPGFGDSGSAARFFYTAKADSDDRIGSKHPTVKPIDLMQWLVRLVTPPGGVVLDPFAGTGTTAEAAFREGMRAVLIEREEEYQADIRRRMALVLAGPEERQRETMKASGKTEAPGPLFDESTWTTMWKEPWVPAE